MGDSLTIDNLSLNDCSSARAAEGAATNRNMDESPSKLLSSPMLRPPLSMRSSLSSNSPSSKFTSKAKKYKGQPSIIDEPQLVDLCEHYTTTKNITGLSLIARQRGLPPHMRHKIWPLLLKTHPFAVKPYITPDEDEEIDDNEINIKDRIKHDIKRYFKRSHNHIDVNNEKMNKQEKKVVSEGGQDLLKIEDEIIKVMQYSILKFLKKWGSLINYNSGLTWIALGLAEWVPPLNSGDENSNYVLCGREFVNKNGDTCLKNVTDELEDYIKYSSYVDEDSPFSSISPSSTSSVYPVFKKTQNGDTTSDDSSVVSASTFTTSNSTATTTTASANPQVIQGAANSKLNGSNTSGGGGANKNMTFAEIYERMVLVILHSPEPSEGSVSSQTSEDEDEEETAKDKITTTLPLKGGTAEERLSFFLYCLRRLLPELAQFFIDEDILNTTSVKDDWVVWWLKWCGAKVWSKYDRGRIWDILLGWRCFDEFANKKELDDLLLDDGNLNLLGPDLFWHPLSVDDPTSERNSNADNLDGHHAGRNSMKSLISSLSVTNLRELSQSPGPQSCREKIPYSNLDPHIEIVFISLSFIKSKEFAFLELDQSEIREFLSKASSTKLYGFQNLFEDEINANENSGSSNNPESNDFVITDTNNEPKAAKMNNEDVFEDSNNNRMRKFKRKNGLRDIENIIMESGELWRKWIWQEVAD